MLHHPSRVHPSHLTQSKQPSECQGSVCKSLIHYNIAKATQRLRLQYFNLKGHSAATSPLVPEHTLYCRIRLTNMILNARPFVCDSITGLYNLFIPSNFTLSPTTSKDPKSMLDVCFLKIKGLFRFSFKNLFFIFMFLKIENSICIIVFKIYF